MKRLGGSFSRLFDELVRERIGLASSRRHEQAKERVLGDAMKRAGVTDEAKYLERIVQDDTEFDALVSDLTVPETYFFRDPPHYELLRREILPALVTARGREHALEVWSAGCATGEEPYSLTILLEQELLASRSHVLGTDVSQRALGRAARATYGRWSMRATDERQRGRYFEQVGREYRLVERIRARVRFQQHSLMASLYPVPKSRSAGFDLILCRNVMIYFDRAAVARTARGLASSLATGGILMLGPSDPLLDIEEWCDTLTTPCGLLYRRRAPGGAKPVRAGRQERLQAMAAARPQRSAAPLPEPQPTAQPAMPPSEPSVQQERAVDALTLAAQVQRLVSEHGVAAAEVSCRALVGLHPLSAAVQLLHATLLVDLERHSAAEQALRRALYLDRTLLVAQMLNANLLERRGEHGEAVRGYEQVAAQSRALGTDQLVFLGADLTHEALAELAEQRARALKNRGVA
ncbi:MAG: methyltransferase, CheR-type [Myxococcaceae bacterium]|nr:methyltransferase, CheR-type [Myxococcaceae bacterium]